MKFVDDFLTTGCHFIHTDSLQLGHVPKHAEDSKPGEQRRCAVDERHENRVAVRVVLEFIVRRHCDEPSRAAAERVEDLHGCVGPDDRIEKPREVGLQVELDADLSAGKSATTDDHDQHHDVGKGAREVNNLQWTPAG